MTTWLVLGAGYTGLRLARALVARGDDVVLTRRRADDATADAAALSVRGLAVDLAAPATLAAALRACETSSLRTGDGDVPRRRADDQRGWEPNGSQPLPSGAIVVHTAPPIDERGTGEAALATAAAIAGVARIVYLSSTAVYAPAAGAWVDEDFALAPTTASGRARLAAEQALAAGLVPCVRLRVAGIHGPGRGVVARLLAGSYRLIGDGATQVSRIHVEDLVTCILAAGDAAAPGPVYNLADDAPCTARDLALTAAALLGLPPPPTVPLAAALPEVAGMLTADRRIDNRRIKRELGVTLHYPSWRTSLPDA